MSTRLGDSFINEQEVNFLTRDAWQNWTPTVTQGVAVAAGGAGEYARYVVIGNTVILQIRLSITGAGTLGQPISIGGVPAAIQSVRVNQWAAIGTGFVYDANAASTYYVGLLIANGANDLRLMVHNTNAFVGTSPSFALANGDVIGFEATYER